MRSFSSERNAWLLKKALAQTFGINATKRSGTLRGSCGEKAAFQISGVVLSLMRSFPSLTFPDPMREFNAGDGDRGAPKALQSKHRTQTKFDRSMVLLDEIVQIFRGPYFGPLAAPMLAEDFPRRPTRSLVIIKCDGARQPALALERPPEKPSAAATSRLVRSRKSTVFPFSDFSGLAFKLSPPEATLRGIAAAPGLRGDLDTFAESDIIDHFRQLILALFKRRQVSTPPSPALTCLDGAL